MGKEIILTDKAPAPAGAYSQAVTAGDFIFVSGQIPVVAATGSLVTEGVHGETNVVVDNIEAVLAAAGSSLKKVVKLTVFLKDINDIKFINDVLNERFGKNLPARTAVEVSRLPKDISVEIDAIAVR
ncbi:MAG: Rid family detoxifying hydrolase [Candidatus Goldiibacteriota bacterium]|jgi:2-iminobutanoate/2-iminopropanoate deaminase